MIKVDTTAEDTWACLNNIYTEIGWSFQRTKGHVGRGPKFSHFLCQTFPLNLLSDIIFFSPRSSFGIDVWWRGVGGQEINNSSIRLQCGKARTGGMFSRPLLSSLFALKTQTLHLQSPIYPLTMHTVWICKCVAYILQTCPESFTWLKMGYANTCATIHVVTNSEVLFTWKVEHAHNHIIHASLGYVNAITCTQKCSIHGIVMNPDVSPHALLLTCSFCLLLMCMTQRTLTKMSTCVYKSMQFTCEPGLIYLGLWMYKNRWLNMH